MSRELIYTSAPRGVRPGSQGFCTVAHTQGMPANLIQQLESLSGYRQIYPPQDPKASLNPVIFSHLALTIAGRRCHVLSRICDAGLDYTHRTNKFAHHVVLDAAEVPSAGPAWLLAQAKFMRSKWTGEPEILPTGPALPSGESVPRVCRSWQQLTGDAGWGGALAETVASPTTRQAVIVFQPGMDMLPLLRESLALLPAELRWNVSFSTYFTKLPAGMGCQWRCVVDGTPEAVAARRSRQSGLVIDLCRPLGRAIGGTYVETARTGKKPATATTVEHLSDAELGYALQDSGCPPVHVGLESSVGGNVTPPPVQLQQQSYQRPTLLRPKRKPSPRWPWVLATAALVVAVVGLGVLAWTMRFGTDKTTKVPQDKANVLATVGKNDGKPNAVKEKETKDAKIAEDKNKAEAERIAAEKKNASDKATVAASAADQAAKLGKSVTAEGKRIAGEVKIAAQAAKNVGADQIAKQAEIAAAEVTNAISVADKAADKATQAARKVEQAIKAGSSVADILNAAQIAERDTSDTKMATENANKAIEVAQMATDAARKAVDTKNDFGKSLQLPSCTVQQQTIGRSLPSLEIKQLQGITAENISTIGLEDVFPKELHITAKWQNDVLQYVAGAQGVPEQLIAHLTSKQEGCPLFQWDEQAKHIADKADLLCNCLLSVNIPGYSKPAILRLRQAILVAPLSFSFLARGETEESQSVDLDSVPPNKEIGFRLLDFPQGWKVEPSKDEQGQERHNAYAITVPGDVPLHFDCTVKADDAKRHKPEWHNDKRFDKKLNVVLTYIGAGYPPQVIYQRDRDKKCNELQHDLDTLEEELQALTKDIKRHDDSQSAHEKNKDEEPIVGLKREIERLQREIEAVEALPNEEGIQLGKLKERTDQLRSKIVQLDRTMKSLATFESNQPVLHYCLFIKVADKGADYKVELLRTERPPHAQ